MALEQKPNLGYKAFKAYVRLYHDNVCYKKTYVLDVDNVPPAGIPTLIATDHQNGVNDVLGVIMSFRDRKPYIITRADALDISPFVNKVFRALGMLPAFRLDFEGEDALSKNEETFKATGKVLLDGGTVMMCPEAGHQDKHWLGPFSYGYTKIAFGAAEMGNFEKEIFILPACNHYSDYFGIRIEIMVRYGTPISLAPYYELYKTKPRTAQREVSKLVRAQIKSMMLSIDDVDYYYELDLLRNTFGVRYALDNGLDPDSLLEKLQSDKKLVETLHGIRLAEHEELGQDVKTPLEQVYDKMREMLVGMQETKMKTRHLDKNPNVCSVVLKLLGCIVLLPLGIFSMWPGAFFYAFADHFANKRMHDRMLEGTFLICVSILVWIPLFSIITLVVTGLCFSWWAGLAWIVLFPVIFIFAWNYQKWCREAVQDLMFLGNASGAKVEFVRNRKNEIFEYIGNIMNNN